MAKNTRIVQLESAIPISGPSLRDGNIRRPTFLPADSRSRTSLRKVDSIGLPAVGSTLVNKWGLRFVVEGHLHAPTVNSIQRWRNGSVSDADLFPVIIPGNLSAKLIALVAAVDRCTTKKLILLDTMPHARRDAGIPGGHWVDTAASGEAILVFIDAAHVHETHLAHELGHLWVQYVDLAEDERVMRDVSDTGRLHQLSFVQSFVTDLRVNQIIADLGFDVSLISADLAASIASLGRAIESGYSPGNRREGVFMALTVATQILEEQRTGPSLIAKLDDTLAKVQHVEPELGRLAMGFAEAVTRHGYGNKKEIQASIDECLELAFNFTGDSLNLERDLTVPTVCEVKIEKYPQWIAGASQEMKCEVGRIMALERIPEDSIWSIAQGPLNTCLLSFELSDGSVRGPWTLDHAGEFAKSRERLEFVNELNRKRNSKQSERESSGMPRFPGHPRRLYMAGNAQFLTRAREAEWTGGEHPYAYASSNPITYIDPSGHQPLECPVHGGEPGCVYSGPSGGQADPAYWHCLTPYPTRKSGPLFDPWGFWRDGVWGYGNCCGPTRKCSPGSKAYNCTDIACREHDNCVGPDIGTGLRRWLPCNKQFCNDIKYCWSQSCAKRPVDEKQCAAIRDIAMAFCNSFGGGPPASGFPWL